jgi:ribonuclease HII
MNKLVYKNSNIVNIVVYKIIGVDEAGKGPVLGSLFIGFSIINLNKKEELENFNSKLKEIGVKDSKKITQKNRVKILESCKELDNIETHYEKLTPIEIDENAKVSKLNNLEVRKICQVLNKKKPNLIIIDALVADTEKFKLEIKAKLDFDCEIISENKADDKYEIVGLASIIAKVNRELEIENLKNKFNIDFGSGYPSDSKTINFLKNNFKDKNLRELFRKSWQTYKRLNNKTLFDY